MYLWNIVSPFCTSSGSNSNTSRLASHLVDSYFYCDNLSSTSPTCSLDLIFNYCLSLFNFTFTTKDDHCLTSIPSHCAFTKSEYPANSLHPLKTRNGLGLQLISFSFNTRQWTESSRSNTHCATYGHWTNQSFDSKNRSNRLIADPSERWRQRWIEVTHQTPSRTPPST